MRRAVPGPGCADQGWRPMRDCRGHEPGRRPGAPAWPRSPSPTSPPASTTATPGAVGVRVPRRAEGRSPDMKIAVIGAMGTADSRTAGKLKEKAIATVAVSRSIGVYLITGAGLRETLEGVDLVIDTSNAFPANESLGLYEALTSPRATWWKRAPHSRSRIWCSCPSSESKTLCPTTSPTTSPRGHMSPSSPPAPSRRSS